MTAPQPDQAAFSSPTRPAKTHVPKVRFTQPNPPPPDTAHSWHLLLCLLHLQHSPSIPLPPSWFRTWLVFVDYPICSISTTQPQSLSACAAGIYFFFPHSGRTLAKENTNCPPPAALCAGRCGRSAAGPGGARPASSGTSRDPARPGRHPAGPAAIHSRHPAGLAGIQRDQPPSTAAIQRDQPPSSGTSRHPQPPSSGATPPSSGSPRPGTAPALPGRAEELSAAGGCGAVPAVPRSIPGRRSAEAVPPAPGGLGAPLTLLPSFPPAKGFTKGKGSRISLPRSLFCFFFLFPSLWKG
ncbi:uncharacterized protein [Taeniopygia guttata]|uniref:uncharacterized protein n=1 Tax=Taeniopygia guttata TaxID=59729 RepID=UPI003BB98BEC